MSCTRTILGKFVFVVSLIASLSLIGCSSLMLESAWREGDTPADGKGDGWRSTLLVLEDKKTTIGVLNDADYLYLRLATTNRELEGQIIRRGLSFWFDGDGGDKKKFGIHFPLGISRVDGFRRDRRAETGDSVAPRRDSIMIPVNDLEILGPDQGETHRMSFAEATGIDARFQTTRDTLTYTLKVPISSSGYLPFTVGARPGAVVGVTLETANLRGAGRSSEGSGEGGGRRGGGGSGGRGGYGGRGAYGGGGYGGRGYGRGKSGDSEQTKPFSQFVKIQLADSTSH